MIGLGVVSNDTLPIFIITGQAIFVLRDKITVVIALHKTSSVEMAEIMRA